MPVSQSQKKATEKWDKQNMTCISCRITKEKAVLFKDACKKTGTVPNRVLLGAINDTIQKAEGLE